MLVLKRKVGEKVIIGDDIEVHVLAVEGETVKLGFVAPKEIEILRSEVFEMIREENLLAGKPNVSREELKGILGELLGNEKQNIDKKGEE